MARLAKRVASSSASATMRCSRTLMLWGSNISPSPDIPRRAGAAITGCVADLAGRLPGPHRRLNGAGQREQPYYSVDPGAPPSQPDAPDRWLRTCPAHAQTTCLPRRGQAQHRIPPERHSSSPGCVTQLHVDAVRQLAIEQPGWSAWPARKAQRIGAFTALLQVRTQLGRAIGLG